MLDVDLNPSDTVEQHLAGLQRCFPGWGDAATYAWAFEREVGGPRADVLLVHSGGAVIAGSGITYRNVRLPDGRAVLGGIMTGSWTLPEARGQGCFTRMIAESRRVAADRRAGVLLAFVTRDNPSARRLLAEGAATFPTWYCRGGPDASTAVGGWATPIVEPVVPTSLPAIAERAAEGHSHIIYPSAASWASQFVERSDDCQVLRLRARPGDGFAVRERTATSDRLHLVLVGDRRERRRWLRNLRADAASGGRELFCFASRREMADDCAAVGLHLRDGWLTALAADSDALAAGLGVEEEWRPGTDERLGDPESPWFLGPWVVHGGDRM